MSTLDLTMDTSNCSQDERYQRIQHVFSSTLPPGEKLDTVSPLLDEWFKQEHARPWMEKQGRPSKTMLLELRDNLAHLMELVHQEFVGDVCKMLEPCRVSLKPC